MTAPWFGGCNGATELREVWVSAQGSASREYGAAWVDTSGNAERVSVGFRGHDVVQHPLHLERVLLIARHPGRQMVEVDLLDRRVVRYVHCTDNHEHGGHACFSADGAALFSAESDYELGQGRIVVRDANDYRVLDEYPSHGIGPHELALMPDGQTLVVANGGLLTHPDSGGDVQNLATMDSSLSFINSQNGELLDEYRVQETKASIRHIDVSDTGEVSVALQMQREAANHDSLAPLAAIYRPGSDLGVLEAPEALLLHCKDYMGSTRINAQTNIVGYTSPRGDIALFWDLRSGEFAGYHRFHDVCGIAVSLDGSAFILSNSTGQLRRLDAITLDQLPGAFEQDGFEWDNHMRAIKLLA